MRKVGAVMALSQERSRLVRRLGTRKSRVREGLVVVEGVRAAREALMARMEVRFAVTTPRLGELTGGQDLADILGDSGAELVEVGDRDLSELSDTEHHQGVLLVVKQPVTDLSEVVQAPRCLILDAIQDPGNVGSLVRAARGFAVDGVIALDGTVDVWSAKAVRASAGAVFTMPVVHARWEEVLPALSEEGVPVLVADSAGRSVREWRERQRFALAVGNEGAGVRPEILEAAAGVVSVPMPGATESLNVGMAGAVLLFELTQEYKG
ncbi:MAG: RNA methyltransferase [Gemmatimonadales bacterium]|nr:RNA methyltransferase [Gemmatimonadales bacterium]MBT7126952.1 RNA methyltransferase [Gemmatimonadales bacterium]